MGQCILGIIQLEDSPIKLCAPDWCTHIDCHSPRIGPLGGSFCRVTNSGASRSGAKQHVLVEGGRRAFQEVGRWNGVVEGKTQEAGLVEATVAVS